MTRGRAARRPSARAQRPDPRSPLRRALWAALRWALRRRRAQPPVAPEPPPPRVRGRACAGGRDGARRSD